MHKFRTIEQLIHT